MAEPALDWETCKHSELSASMAVMIAERHADEETAEKIKEDIHSHVSGMIMARGARRIPRSYR